MSQFIVIWRRYRRLSITGKFLFVRSLVLFGPKVQLLLRKCSEKKWERRKSAAISTIAIALSLFSESLAESVRILQEKEEQMRVKLFTFTEILNYSIRRAKSLGEKISWVRDWRATFSPLDFSSVSSVSIFKSTGRLVSPAFLWKPFRLLDIQIEPTKQLRIKS